MSDGHDDDADVEAIVTSAIAELLNIAAQVADLQATDEAAEDIFALCDIVAEYYQIERSVAVTTEHDDGSFTTRFETYTGATPEPAMVKREPIPGSIRTAGKPKLRLIDCDGPVKNSTKKPPRKP